VLQRPRPFPLSLGEQDELGFAALEELGAFGFGFVETALKCALALVAPEIVIAIC
jgi:hypothetical protein